MNRELNKLFSMLKSQSLTAAEKSSSKKAVLDFMAVNPLVKNSQSSRQSAARFVPWYLSLTSQPVFVPMILIIALLAGGGTSLAAERALPGDLLYPIKIYVNEQAMKYAAFSEESKANVDVSLASRRLTEAEQLAAQNRLTVGTKNDLSAAVNDHADHAGQIAAAIASSGNVVSAAGIQSEFEALLKSHAVILLGLSGNQSTVTSSTTKALLGDLAARLGERAKVASDDETKFENQVTGGNSPDVQAAAGGKLNAAQNKLAEVQSFVEKNKNSVSVDVYAAAQAKIAAAAADIASGQQLLASGDNAGAFGKFQEAQQFAQEAKVMVAGARDVGYGTLIRINISGESTTTQNLRDQESSTTPQINSNEDSKHQIQSIINQANGIKAHYRVNINGGDNSEIEDGASRDGLKINSGSTATGTPAIRRRSDDNENQNYGREDGSVNINNSVNIELE